MRTHLQMLAHLARALQDPAFRVAVERRADIDTLVAEAARIEASPGEPP